MNRNLRAVLTLCALGLLFLSTHAFSQGCYSGGYNSGCYGYSSGGYGCGPSNCYNDNYGRGYSNDYNNHCQPYRTRPHRAVRQYTYSNNPSGDFYSSTPGSTYMAPDFSAHGQPTPQQNAERINRLEALLNLLITKLSALFDLDWDSSDDGSKVVPNFSNPSRGDSCAGGT